MIKNKDDLKVFWKRLTLEDDERAFELFFYSLNRPLIKFCIQYVHQREAAEEIVSDVFVKIWMNRKCLALVENPDTYMYVAVKNHSLNHVRKYSGTSLVQIEETAELKLVSTSNPEQAFEKKELIFKLDQAVETLPQQCRIIFRLIKEDGLRYKEVAEIMNLSPRTVQTHLFRAMKKLSVTLQEYHSSFNHLSGKETAIKLGLLFYASAKIYFMTL